MLRKKCRTFVNTFWTSIKIKEEKTLIEVKNVTKKYGNFYAVRNINFEVKEGEIVGFLGPPMLWRLNFYVYICISKH